MLNKNKIINNFKDLEIALKNRNSKIDVSVLSKLLLDSKKLMLEIEDLNKKRNSISANISLLMKNKDNLAIEKSKKEVLNIKNKLTKLEEKLKKLNVKIDDSLLSIPNIPQSDVPVGKDENDNKEIKKFLSPTKFDFNFLPHWELGIKKDIVDFDRATKITGSRFVVYKGKGAQLMRALQMFTLDEHQKDNYCEFVMPVIVNDKSLYGTGNLPKFADDLFRLEKTNYYLSPTLEVQLTNYYNNEILDEKKLPLRFTASSINFRSEAGSAGRDTKGVIRQHQFYKTELVNITTPNQSSQEHENMVLQAEKILEKLSLPYRRILLCTGDMGFSSAKTYDIEVWLPSYNNYKEISSVSNCEDFQARRSMIRYKNEANNKNELVHTLNGSALAIDRLWAAVVENFQDKNGDIIVPKELIKYTGFDKI